MITELDLSLKIACEHRTTIVANVFYFSHTPLMQRLAVELKVDAQLAALLMASRQCGSVLASVAFIYYRPRRLGLLYTLGAIGASCLLPLAAVLTDYWLVFASLVVAAIGSGFFGSTQSTLVMTAVSDE